VSVSSEQRDRVGHRTTIIWEGYSDRRGCQNGRALGGAAQQKEVHSHVLQQGINKHALHFHFLAFQTDMLNVDNAICIFKDSPHCLMPSALLKIVLIV
jgi:hypothetical protein